MEMEERKEGGGGGGELMKFVRCHCLKLSDV